MGQRGVRRRRGHYVDCAMALGTPCSSGSCVLGCHKVHTGVNTGGTGRVVLVELSRLDRNRERAVLGAIWGCIVGLRGLRFLFCSVRFNGSSAVSSYYRRFIVLLSRLMQGSRCIRVLAQAGVLPLLGSRELSTSKPPTRLQHQPRRNSVFGKLPSMLLLGKNADVRSSRWPSRPSVG